ALRRSPPGNPAATKDTLGRPGGRDDPGSAQSPHRAQERPDQLGFFSSFFSSFFPFLPFFPFISFFSLVSFLPFFFLVSFFSSFLFSSFFGASCAFAALETAKKETNIKAPRSLFIFSPVPPVCARRCAGL